MNFGEARKRANALANEFVEAYGLKRGAVTAELQARTTQDFARTPEEARSLVTTGDLSDYRMLSLLRAGDAPACNLVEGGIIHIVLNYRNDDGLIDVTHGWLGNDTYPPMLLGID